MEEMEFMLKEHTKMPVLNKPVLIEGLPGVGNVGKLAAEHLLDEIKAEHFADIYSKYFPPQVTVGDDGLTELVCNSLYYYKRTEKGEGPWKERDILLLIGDYQGLTPEGQYSLCYNLLGLVKKMGVERIFTLGGYGLGRIVEDVRVLGAATSTELVAEMKEHNIVFGSGEPGSGIVGASGLLLGMSHMFNMEGVCLMGETSGYFVDPKSARAVLEILSSILGIELDFAALETRAKEIEQITSKLRDMEEGAALEAVGDDTLRYIG